MKNIIVILAFTLFATTSYSAEKNRSLSMSCQDFSWGDVESLVQPHLDDMLYTALVMQAESSNYSSSAAAIQAMDKSLPDIVKRILQSIIKAGC